MSSEAGRMRGLGAIAVALAGLVYIKALHNPFVYDDAVTVVHNTSLRDLTNFRQIWTGSVFRPATNFSYILDRALWGTTPFGYHVTSVLLHMLNTAALFALTWVAVDDWANRGTTRLRTAPIAFTAAALFAVHPMMTEAVAYVSGRSEVLCGTFFLLSMLAMRNSLRANLHRGWLALALAFALLAVSSREIAVILPLVWLAYDRWLLTGSAEASRRRLLTLHLPSIAVVVIIAALRVAGFLWIEGNGGPSAPAVPYIASQFTVIWRYLGLLAAPINQSIVHDVRDVPTLADGPTVLAAAGLLAVGVLAVRFRRAQPVVAFGIAWFLLLLIPSSVVPLQEPMAEHRVYLASAGMFMAAGVGFGSVWSLLTPAGSLARALTTISLVTVLTFLALLTTIRIQLWGDPVGLWLDAVRRAPHSWSSYFGLGSALADRGDCRDAVPAFQAALERSPRPYIWVNLGSCLASDRKTGDAARAFNAALALDSQYAPAHYNLGLLALRAGEEEQAHRQFLSAISGKARDMAWWPQLLPLYERSIHDPRKTLELCTAIYRVSSEPWVTDCIARYERLLAGRSRG